MQPLVRSDGISKSFGPTHVLRDAKFLLHRGDKVALVGPNGAGKTTLFRILAGQLRPDVGELEAHPDLTVSYLPQVPDVAPETPVADLLAAPSTAAQRLQREAAALEAWMAEPTAWDEPDANEKMARYSLVQTQLAEEMNKGRATDSPLLNDLGLPEEVLSAKFGSLSGGERSKVLLCKALASKETDLILLDEPTNHLDIPTVEFVEQLLNDLPGAVIVSAHDKYLLDNVADRVFEVDNRAVHAYTGNYSSYLGQRAAIARAIDAKRRREYNEVQRQLAIIEELRRRNKFDPQVRSRRIRLGRGGAGEDGERPTDYKGFRLVFEAERMPKQMVRVDGVAKSFQGASPPGAPSAGTHGGPAAGSSRRMLFSGAEFEIESGDKIGLIGPNGCGKSTLLKLLIGRLQPDAGEVKVAAGVRIGYFDQHHETLEADRTLLDEVRTLRDPPPPDEWTRGLLGRFKFSGDEVFKKVRSLSGGERARLALAKFIADRHNLLILDEPTNHLDLVSQDIVAGALAAFEGSVIVVSHNRSFLDQVCNRTMLIAHRRVGVFSGNFSGAWTSQQLADFAKTGVKGRYKVVKAFRDWEKGDRFHAGQTLTITGMETQAFRRLLRWADNEGYVEPL